MIKDSYPVMTFSEPEQAEQGPGRQKMSDGVTVNGKPNCENHGGDQADAASFNDADGVKSGLSRRSPMNHTAAYRDSRGVNNKSRSKYDGAN